MGVKSLVYFHTYEYLARRLHAQQGSWGFSVEELANNAGVDAQTVRDLESGQVKVAIVPMRKVLEAVGFEPIALPGALREQEPHGTYTLEEAVERLDA